MESTMSSTPEALPRAFVIMPFDREFASVYQDLIRPALNESGYAVSRADEQPHHRSLLRDIIQSIEEAALIVADLTADKPNVYYELGIAHALNKPVIMMTRDIDRLPFDLKAYRVIPYSTQLSDALRAHKALQEVATGLLTGTTRFSNPVSDSLGTDVVLPTPATADQEAALGILDHVDNLEQHTQAMTASMTRISERTVEYSESLRKSTTEFEELANGSTGTPTRQQIRALLRETTTAFNSYGTFLANENDTYQATLDPLETSLEGLITLQTPSTSEQRHEFASNLNSLSDLQEVAESALTSLGEMSAAVDSIPPIEQKFNQAQKKVSRELDRLVGNIGLTASIVKRAKELGEAKLAG